MSYDKCNIAARKINAEGAERIGEGLPVFYHRGEQQRPPQTILKEGEAEEMRVRSDRLPPCLFHTESPLQGE